MQNELQYFLGEYLFAASMQYIFSESPPEILKTPLAWAEFKIKIE